MPSVGGPVSSIFQVIFYCCCVLLLIADRAQGKIIRPTSPEIYLTSGSQLHIICEHQSPNMRSRSEMGRVITWSKAMYSGGGNSSTWPRDRDLSYQAIDTTGESAPYNINQRPGVGTYVISELVKEDVTLYDSGFYRCHLDAGGPSNRILVIVIDISTRSGFLERKYNDTQLECSVTDQDGNNNYSVTWYKYGVAEQEGTRIATSDANKQWVSEPKYTISRRFHGAGNGISESGSTGFTVVLMIKRANRNDIGVYECVVDVDGAKTHEILKQEAHLYASPHVDSFLQSESVTQGNALELKCSAWGWPLPQVTWYRENVELVSNERVIFRNESGIIGVKLIIVDMGKDPGDRAKYTCVATTSGTRPQLGDGSVRDGTNATVLVRVKGRLAVLWPILGLAAEAIILCVIITVYELRRNAKLAKQSESIEDLQQTNTASAEHSKSNKSTNHAANSHGEHGNAGATCQDHSWQRKIN